MDNSGFNSEEKDLGRNMGKIVEIQDLVRTDTLSKFKVIYKYGYYPIIRFLSILDPKSNIRRSLDSQENIFKPTRRL